MIVVVNVNRCKEISLQPNDIIMDLSSSKHSRVTRVVENRLHTYVVLTDGTWRPLSSYGKTWRKAFEE